MIKRRTAELYFEWNNMKKRNIIISLLGAVIVALMIVGGILLTNSLKTTAVEFINRSNTTLYYKLGKTDNTIYTQTFVKNEYDDGYEYATVERDFIKL